MNMRDLMEALEKNKAAYFEKLLQEEEKELQRIRAERSADTSQNVETKSPPTRNPDCMIAMRIEHSE